MVVERSTPRAANPPIVLTPPPNSPAKLKHDEQKHSGANFALQKDVRNGRLLQDTRGAVLTEYVVLVGAVGLVVASAIAVAGVDLIHRFETARLILMMPVP